ncbi:MULTISPECIES: hypothetical protein [unclassified Wenzhouxiangella]|uniref:hypothetical protein n=1 Tax=unclassified Wenzhouxiangella TaxID=2613841 RepID=UPI000E327DC9|nr:MULTISPECIES: hypothetical protein [unclassified Wenzhouxiangella]RFF27438.1 hypothetical protein DZK25_08535 [Wenzhouxiangella sp. 15181]RFP68866.1 hypothetical protein DZK26_06980 [Wenzhouxiangella sp. 15190]
MQKFLVGCLIVVVVLVGVGGTAGYFFFIKPAWEFAGGVQEFVQEYAELNEQVERQDGFSPPEDGSITNEQFQRFLVAQRDMRQAMEGELGDLEQRFESMQEQIDEEQRDANIGELFTAYQGLGELLIEAKRVQVEALNRYNFSLQEYLYVRNQIYRALGQEVAVASFGDQAPQMRDYQVPDEVVEMVSSHREELMEGYAFAWFGI